MEELEKDFYKKYIKEVIGGIDSLRVEEAMEMLNLYKFINNDLTGFRSMVERYCDPSGILGVTVEDLVPYNPVVNKLNVLLGEVISRGNVHKTLTLSGKEIKKKNEELLAVYKQEVDKLVEQATQGQQVTKEQIEQMQKEAMPKTLNYLTESEKFSTKLLNYVYATDSKDKQADSYKDLYTTGKCFIYAGWEKGKPSIQICNTINTGFSKSPNQTDISKSDYVWHVDYITIQDALTKYQNSISKEDVKELKQNRGTYTAGKPSTEDSYNNIYRDQLINEYQLQPDKEIGLSTGGYERKRGELIKRVHIEFKHFKEVKFLSYTDELGEKVTIMLDSKFKEPKDANTVKFTNRWGLEATKKVWFEENNMFECESLIVPRRHECTVLDDRIYVNCREVPFQPDLIENPEEDFTLSYKGIIINNRNAKVLSPIQQALPYAFQYMSVKRVQDRELAKYAGSGTNIDVDQIPDDLALDNEGNPLQGTDKLMNSIIIRHKTGFNFYSGSKSNNGLPIPATRGTGISGEMISSAGELINLQQFAQMVNAELGIALGIPPQREAQVTAGTNVTDNRQALQQSTLVTQVINYHHDKLWQEVYKETLRNYYQYFRNLFLSNDWNTYHYEYITSEGTKEFIEVSPTNIESLKDIGIYVMSTGKDKLYFDFMMQSVHALAQNQAEGVEVLSEVIKAITSSAGPEEVHEMIKRASIKQQERQAQMNQQLEQRDKQLIDAQRELEIFKSELRVKEQMAINDIKGNVEIEKARISAMTYALSADIDKNNENDAIQEAKLKLEHDSIEAQKDRDFEREENQKDRVVEIKKISNKPTVK